MRFKSLPSIVRRAHINGNFDNTRIVADTIMSQPGRPPSAPHVSAGFYESWIEP